MKLIRKSQAALLGIDISSTTVKLLQLSRSGERYRVEHYAVEPLPFNAVVEKSIVEFDQVVAAVQRALARAGSSLKTAAAAVAGASVITKLIPMPADLSEDELEAQVELEAANYIPYPIDEVNIDFEAVGPMPGAPDMQQVLLVAARSEEVAARQGVLEAAGLKARVIDVESFAVENAFSLIAPDLNLPTGGLVALVDIGANSTTLNILRDGRSLYSREQAFGGKQLTEEIMRRYGLSWEQAERGKRSGGLPAAYEEEVLEPFCESLVQQISRLLQFYYASSEYSRVDQVVLSGGGASISGLAQQVEEHLGMQTMVANPLARMTLNGRVQAQELAQDAPSLMIACGLALRSFD
ncbi:MAG: pilus assembly protein PilM [Pseudomonadota bacterium]|nr:pilus assembly protein PilM [Pseudomonadota bacterium]